MLIDGISLVEGSQITNATIATGLQAARDALAASQGELFFVTDINPPGTLFVYDGSFWVPVAASGASYVITGDVTGTINGAPDVLTLATVNSNVGNFASVTVNAKGLVTAAADLFGDATSSGAELTLVTVNSNVGTFGSAISVPVITANAKGLVTAVTTAPITFSITGDITGTIDGGTDILTLATVNGNVGSFGTAANVPTFAVNAKGLITSASNTAIAIAASQTTSGTFADARISSSSVTQHQAALTILETQISDGALLARSAENETITGSWTFNNVTVGVDPTLASHLATKQYVDNSISGLDMKQSVRAATTANITLSAPQTVDGVSVIAGDRVLVKNQTTGSLNGIYVVAAGAWTRSTDADTSAEVTTGMYTFVAEGTTNGDSGWALITDDPITLGSTSLTFAQFTGLGQVVAGNGLTKTGSTIDVVGTAGRIVSNVDSIDLDTVGTAGTYKSVTTDVYGRVTAGTNPTTLAGFGITDAQPLDTDLTALAVIGTTGLYTITATGSSTTRQIVAPAAGITITNGSGTAGNPTLVLANDLAALEGLAGTGFAVRTAADAWTQRSIAVSGSGLTISNADGVAGNPTVTSNGTSANTASTLVFRDVSGNFVAGTITAALSGNATTATTLQTARTIGTTGITSTAASFNGSANVTIGVTAVPTTLLTGTVTNAQLTNSSITIGSTNIALGATSTSLAGLTTVSANGAITTTAGAIGTGAPASTGRINMNPGGASNSGYLEFFSAANTRQGYIGFSGTNAASDTGTIPYVAGAHSFTGSITATGDITAFSDRRLKTDIEAILEPLQKVQGLNGVTFRRVDTDDYGTGLIAQDVLAVMPNVVHEAENGMLSVAYGNLAGLFVEAIKALNKEVSELRAEIKALKDNA